ncbi:hypothetical protein Tco_1306425 [Tanacetum coccineum]
MCEEDGDSKENGDTTNDVINGSCEKGASTDVRDKNYEILDVMDAFPTLEEALNRTHSTEYDGNLNTTKPMTENDTESNTSNKQGSKTLKLIPTAIDERREVVLL